MVFHRLRLNPWAYASLPLANHSASSLPLWFSFPSVFVDFLFIVATLNGHSRDFVVPQLLTHHRYIQVHVQVLVLAIWIFVVFLWSTGLAIWTVAVVPHPVVTGHHHRHSLELVLVKVLVIEIAVVIAHAVHFRLLLFLSHQQV